MNKERAREILKGWKRDIEEHTKYVMALKNNGREFEANHYFEMPKEKLDETTQALDIAIESLEREDKLIELAEQNKWHTEQPQEDRQYLVTYYQECDLLIMCKWKNKQWYDTKGIALDNDRVVAWKKVEPYERKE